MPKPPVLALCAMSLAACGYPAPNSVGVFVGTFPPGASCAVVDGARVVGQVDPTPGIVWTSLWARSSTATAASPVL